MTIDGASQIGPSITALAPNHADRPRLTGGVPTLRRLGRVVAVVLLVGVSVSCSASTSSSSDGATSPTASSPSSLAPGEDADRAAVERAYRSAVGAFEAALIDPTSGTETLKVWWSAPALGAVTSEVNTWAGFGQVLRYPSPSRHSVDVEAVSVTGDTATITSCVVDDGQKVDLATGAVLNDEVATVGESAVLHRSAQSWLVVERSQLERHDGAGTCTAR